MRFQSQVDQTKVDFDNQGKNASKCVTVSLGKLLLILKTPASKKVETVFVNAP